MRLEYRLDDETADYPALWHYPDLTVSEVVCRMTCEYFIKDAQTYKVTLTMKDAKGDFIIFLEKENFEDEPGQKHFDYIGFEFREMFDGGTTRVIESRDLFVHDDALAILHCDSIFIKGKEFHLDSREIDEDRKCYVYYGTYDNK